MSKYQPTYNGENNVGRSPSSKASYSPGHWKSYLINDLQTNHNNSRIDKERQSQRGSNIPSSVSQLSYQPHTELADEKVRKRQDMMKRVKQIQKKVMPLIENDQNNVVSEEVGNRSKLEQKVSKLETAIDAIQKEMDIKIQKKILQVQKIYNEKIEALERKLQKK